MSDTNHPSRRDAMKAALKVGIYAAPVVLSATNPSPAAAQASGPTGILTGTISSSANGSPIAGATVAVGSVSALTNASGVYTIPNAPSGSRVVTSSAAGFSTRTDTVNITAGGTTTFSAALVPSSASGNITIILTWGATPSDLDSHLRGPNTGGGRFEVYYGNPNPVPYASLDVDDTSSFGPETVTVRPVAGNFIPGVYNYFVVNYSGSPYFDTSNAVITVFQGGIQIGQYLASAATGSASSAIWSVFTFTLLATPTGSPVLTPVQVFTNTAPADSEHALDRTK